MNDLDICKRIAKIEGLRVSKDVKPKCGGAYASTHTDNPYGSYSVYSPLTNDALCFKLIEKYGVTFNIYHDLDGIKYYYGDFWRDGERIIIPDRQDLKRFVCLYVIELNTGK